MTEEQRPIPQLVRTRLAALLADAAVQAVFATLGPENVRIVGGAVRNAVLGKPVEDIDFATRLPPGEVMARLPAAGFSVHPVGVAHGSILAVGNGRRFEITTLRRDVKTDGRHARVAFCGDWEEDARRRDFTINALYLDHEGRVHDPVGGLADLWARRLRFIGNPEARLREDYLRILRFFRFLAQYDLKVSQDSALAAIRRCRGGLRRISKERVRAEMEKLLLAPAAPKALALMEKTRVVALVFPEDCRRDESILARMIAQDEKLGLQPRWLLRLLALCGAHESLRPAFRLTRAEMKRLRLLAQTPLPADERGWRTLVYRCGKAVARDLARLGAAEGNLESKALQRWLACIDSLPTPKPAVSGRDVLALGVAPGPEVGRVLRAFEERWIADGFSPADRDGQLRLLLALVKERPEKRRGGRKAERES